MKHIIEDRLRKAERQLKADERYYHGDTTFYADQIAYVAALRERLISLIEAGQD
jgi:membrane-bound lytic murein transglycosylase MltF